MVRGDRQNGLVMCWAQSIYVMWFPTLPRDWPSTDPEIPAVLCSFLHANGSLKALISANALTSAFLRWHLPKFWAWNYSNKTKVKTKQKKSLTAACSQMPHKFLSAYSWDFSSSLRESKADPVQHTATSTHPSPRATPRWGSQCILGQQLQAAEQLAKPVLRRSLTRRPLQQQRSVGQAGASHWLHLQPNRSYVSLWMGTYLCIAPSPPFFGCKRLVKVKNIVCYGLRDYLLMYKSLTVGWKEYGSKSGLYKVKRHTGTDYFRGLRIHTWVYLLMVTATRWEKFNFLSQLPTEQRASKVQERYFTSA